jgi:transposase
VVLLVQDEARFGRINIPARTWAPPKHRPIVPRQVVRQAVYAYAAVCPENGSITAMVCDHANTEMMNVFLGEVADEYPQNLVIMQVDGAAWHKSKDLVIPENIHFIIQPPYSPELNSVEHLWDEIREKYFHNLLFESIKAVEETLDTAFRQLQEVPEKIKRMTEFPFLKVTL